ncbi:YggT family protein [Halopseudomonas salegens]|uniref:YggT family protein n=1 Tax=Halopseudomonas salegens TaxID=1434072 RepID=A0A1H2HB04_9GAMM|nr:YggT family protein [Halopseudomonas salegens]SDU29015.1 YggT family protein [Halopseudomonas salegens]
MTGLDSAASYLIQTLGSLYLLVVLLRFILQTVRADFYNPLTQFIVRATAPLLKPLRRVIPGFGGIDFASLLLALVIQAILIGLLLGLAGGGMPGLLQIIVWSLVGITALFVKIFFFALIISVILSWVAPQSQNPAALIVHQICEPLLAPIRRFLPSMGGLDLSPIFAFIALRLVDMLLITNLAIATGMPRGLTLAY